MAVVCWLFVVVVVGVVDFTGVDSADRDVSWEDGRGSGFGVGKEERPAVLRPLEVDNGDVPWGGGRDDRDARSGTGEVVEAGAPFAACSDPRFVREKGDGAGCPVESDESEESDMEGSCTVFEPRSTEGEVFGAIPARLERGFSPSDCAGEA